MWNTWGTHLGDTKLVASIDERPVFDSMSINLIFVCVGTIACKDTMICYGRVLHLSLFQAPLDGSTVFQ